MLRPCAAAAGMSIRLPMFSSYYYEPSTFNAASDVQESIVVFLANVPRLHPEVVIKRLQRHVLHVNVSHEHIPTVHAHLPQHTVTPCRNTPTTITSISVFQVNPDQTNQTSLTFFLHVFWNWTYRKSGMNLLGQYLSRYLCQNVKKNKFI